MARKKLAHQVRQERAACRDVRRLEPVEREDWAGSGPEPTPSRILEVRDLPEGGTSDRLRPEERDLADRRARGQEWPQIAADLGGTPSGRRKQLVRSRSGGARNWAWTNSTMTEPRLTAPPSDSDSPGRLEELWRQGQRPDLGAFLAGAGHVSASNLLAVLLIDQEERWLAGEEVWAEDYLAAHSALNDDPEKVVELIYAESLLREQLGDSSSLEEYPARFPAYADRLRDQIKLHRLLMQTLPTLIPSSTLEGTPNPPTCPVVGDGTSGLSLRG